jgi:hypothetical protein
MALAFLADIPDCSDLEAVPGIPEHGFKDIISDLIAHFSLQSLAQETTQNKRVVIGNGVTHSSPPSGLETTTALNNSRSLATVFNKCLSQNLLSEIDQLVSIIVRDANTISLSAFEMLLLPFQKLLIQLLQQDKQPLAQPPIEGLYRKLLSTYVIRYVKAQPSPPTDWKLPVVNPSACAVHCRDCTMLNLFLLDPNKYIERFKFDHQSRKSHQVLLKSLSEVRSEIDRTVSPQMLVVTKELTKYPKDHKAWKERCEVARKHFQDLGLSNLKVILGSMYDPITTLLPHQFAAFKASNETLLDNFPPLGESGEASNRHLPPISKRKLPNGEILIIDD